MKNIFTHISTALANLSQALRPVVVTCVCTILIFSATAPALAFGNSDSRPSQGLAQMENIQEKAENAAASGSKTNANSTRSVSKDANEGLNGVQGSADKGRMVSPEDTNATSVETAVEDFLETVTP